MINRQFFRIEVFLIIASAHFLPPNPKEIAKAKPTEPKKILTIFDMMPSPIPICVNAIAMVKMRWNKILAFQPNQDSQNYFLRDYLRQDYL